MADVPELEATLFRNSRLERIAANRSTGPLLPGVYAGTVHGLASHAIVVRGGLMREGDLAKSAEKFWRRHDRYGISVFASDTKSLAQIVEAGRIPYRQVRLATAGSLAAAGFVLTKTSGPDHYTLGVGRYRAD